MYIQAVLYQKKACFYSFVSCIKRADILLYVINPQSCAYIYIYNTHSFLAHYICLVLWMTMKKHISALVYMAIAFIMLFGVQQLERSCSLKDRCAASILQGPDVVGQLPQ